MQVRVWGIVLVCLTALCLAQPVGLVAPAYAAKKESKKPEVKKKDGKDNGPIGYGGPHLRLSPIMAPYQSSGGVRYQPMIVEVEVVGAVGEGEKLDTEGNLRQKQACFIIPLIHDRIVQYLFKAHLTSEDFSGERRDVLQKKLFDEIIAMVGKGFYINLTILGDDPPALDPASQTLSVQCR
jgi:hypothetical protein